jgi:hypothetical protein
MLRVVYLDLNCKKREINVHTQVKYIKQNLHDFISLEFK